MKLYKLYLEAGHGQSRVELTVAEDQLDLATSILKKMKRQGESIRAHETRDGRALMTRGELEDWARDEGVRTACAVRVASRWLQSSRGLRSVGELFNKARNDETWLHILQEVASGFGHRTGLPYRRAVEILQEEMLESGEDAVLEEVNLTVRDIWEDAKGFR